MSPSGGEAILIISDNPALQLHWHHIGANRRYEYIGRRGAACYFKNLE